MKSSAVLVAGLALLAACSSPPLPRPDNREAAYQANNRGVAHLEQYAYDQAVESFQRAIALDDRVSLPYLNLVVALYYASKVDAAQQAIVVAEQRFPDSPSVSFMQGLLARAANRPADAEASFKRVLSLDPDDAASMVNLGQIYLQERRNDEAITVLRNAVAREPSNASARYALGQALIRSGARDEGARETKLFETLRDTGAGVTYSQTYLEQGRYAEALVSTGLEVDLVQRAAVPLRFTEQTALWAGPGPLAISATPQGPIQRQTSAPHPVRSGPTLALSDIDVDGDLDLLVGDANGARLFKWSNGRFADSTRASGLTGQQAVSGIAVADLDNDERPDLLLLHPRGISLRRQTADGTLTTFRRQPLLTLTPETGAMLDADHDGDLDLIVAGRGMFAGRSGLALLRNDGRGDFIEMTAPARLGIASRVTAILPVDFDNRRDVDVVSLVEGQPASLFQNQRDGSFRDVGPQVGLTKLTGLSHLASCDLNKDGFADLIATGESNRGLLAFSNGHGRFDVRDAPERTRGMTAVQCADYDNDGVLDLIGAGADGLRLLRHVGSDFVDVTSDSLGERLAALGPTHAIALGDIDTDGDLDVAISSGAGVRLLRNDGGSTQPSARIGLKARISNRSSIGARVDVRAGSLWQRLERIAATPPVGPEALSIGLGAHANADAIRVLWPSGIVQAETDLTSRTLSIVELDRKPSSCPFLYTWNGERFEFVTDLLGGGELGYWHGPGQYSQPDPDEFVRISSSQLRPRNGRLELRVTNELEEVLYLDRATLLSVDHPTDVEVYPREGMRAAAAHGLELVAVRNVRPMNRAWSDRGEDVTALLATRDGAFTTAFIPRSIRGYADAHDLIFEPPAPVTPGSAKVLLLTGWTDYPFSSDNVGAWQRGWTMAPPRLEVRAPDGTWRLLDPDVGVPVGRPQTLVVRIGTAARAGAQFRLRTNMRIHWDAIAIADVASDVTLTPREHPLSAATLRWRGFSAIDDSMTPRPAIPDYARVLGTSPWKTFPGRYTREGDVRALLGGPDDLFVIARTGDEVQLEFDDRSEGESTGGSNHLRQGYGGPPKLYAKAEDRPLRTRTYLFGGVGFSKEMDLNSASPDVVLPLPSRAMTRYPSLPSAETRARQRELLDRYNTRIVARSLPSLTAPQR